jgi:Zn-finger nucleic acid-binding protein
MRIIVACSQCNRQYDAKGKLVGRKFHCHCGEVLTVERPRGHDAAVVCCSSCGAARMKGALSCEHCDGDFTLHERDLHTVCPHCLTRVSDRARFCHSCGKRINPEMVAGEKSDLCCPECGPEYRLASRACGDVSAMECDRCAGMWMGNESFRQLADAASSDSLNVDSHRWARRARSGHSDVTISDPKRYRPCAKCRSLMVRRLYGRSSGVIIDICKDHGTWFDADELPRILDWIRSGGLARANREKAREEARKQAMRVPQSFGRGEMLRDTSGAEGSIIELALEGLFTWFSKR